MKIRHAAGLPILAMAGAMTVSLTGTGPAALASARPAGTAAGGGSWSAAAQPMTVRRPFGPGCSAVPRTGKGSFTGMAADPVATAASHNPVLSTLVAAVKKAGLVDTLNGADGITVFAPTDQAFAKIPKATLAKVLADRKTLTAILTYHVVKGRKTPADLRRGRFTTLQGGAVATRGSGATYMINNARVVCGDVPTRNATVYLIDTVLMPKS
ncbi:fasciclin domain-containing protein [Actinomadura sp. ATCC 31491]|uniref:Fasciclin domain-containing protein n=1 Tax=Actinomadura luzonensis TaxID=2805427 RepID=A0ABT0G2C0_9ACTN|nr:fasciclin domain-containing protein [Actinomadura luzonensis]MCK2218251.1 fasciclin domain-containing protein [Actinomadura luzonensis]